MQSPPKLSIITLSPWQEITAINWNKKATFSSIFKEPEFCVIAISHHESDWNDFAAIGSWFPQLMGGVRKLREKTWRVERIIAVTSVEQLGSGLINQRVLLSYDSEKREPFFFFLRNLAILIVFGLSESQSRYLCICDVQFLPPTCEKKTGSRARCVPTNKICAFSFDYMGQSWLNIEAISALHVFGDNERCFAKTFESVACSIRFYKVAASHLLSIVFHCDLSLAINDRPRT